MSPAYENTSWDFFKKSFYELRNREDISYRSVFMNPPFSNPKPFIRKAWEDNKFVKFVILVPASILSCRYLDFLDNNYVDGVFSSPLRSWIQGVEIIHLSERTKFIHPSLRESKSSPPFGCMLMIFDRRTEK